MRLDHLLSKEHLPVNRGAGPWPPECGGGGSDGGDTGKFLSAAAGLVVQLWFRPGCGSGVRCGWRERWAPCWVSERTSSGWAGWPGGSWFLGSDHFLAFIPSAVAGLVFAGGVCGWLFVEMWIVDARASLFSARVLFACVVL